MLFIEKLDSKQFYTIKDICEVTGKTSQTVRSWERKGIIVKPEEKFENNWRKYSRETFIKTLEDLINYQWQRNVIQNKTEIEFYIDYLKGNKTVSEMSLKED